MKKPYFCDSYMVWEKDTDGRYWMESQYGLYCLIEQCSEMWGVRWYGTYGSDMLIEFVSKEKAKEKCDKHNREISRG